jgi:hypothetical protein
MIHMETTVEDTDYLLTNDDRCDVCDSQAYVYVNFESGHLLFCLHHWKKNQENASKTATEIHDESERLLLR